MPCPRPKATLGIHSRPEQQLSTVYATLPSLVCDVLQSMVLIEKSTSDNRSGPSTTHRTDGRIPAILTPVDTHPKKLCPRHLESTLTLLRDHIPPSAWAEGPAPGTLSPKELFSSVWRACCGRLTSAQNWTLPASPSLLSETQLWMLWSQGLSPFSQSRFSFSHALRRAAY